jgi:hypothetical protein
MSASYLDIDLAIDNEGYDINQYICSNIPAAPSYGVYISQLIRYSIKWKDIIYIVEREIFIKLNRTNSFNLLFVCLLKRLMS